MSNSPWVAEERSLGSVEMFAPAIIPMVFTGNCGSRVSCRFSVREIACSRGRIKTIVAGRMGEGLRGSQEGGQDRRGNPGQCGAKKEDRTGVQISLPGHRTGAASQQRVGECEPNYL